MTTQQPQQQGIEVPSEALPSDGMSRFVRMGAWAAMVSGLATGGLASHGVARRSP